MRTAVGVTTVGELASAIPLRQEEASIVAELQAGSEDAYAWLIAQFHQPIYSLVYRILDDPSDAPDTTQEVFLKVFRGIQRFNGESSLKTWIYRIALHEASNRRRWWFRHKVRETAIEPTFEQEDGVRFTCAGALVDEAASPLEVLMHSEAREKLEDILKELPEPYRTTVILRDIEELSYEQIAEVMDVSLGTVKSRLVRGRDALKKRLLRCVQEVGPALGLDVRDRTGAEGRRTRGKSAMGSHEVEVTS
ncbi:MAG TPA: sigma-70 family RNA polymerase sigma factor [Clostridia bacterium]|nr:sigma-70 family RNA polymerase sigma factor [Clostridia bacterium]